jgi:hypothetical protein
MQHNPDTITETAVLHSIDWAIVTSEAEIGRASFLKFPALGMLSDLAIPFTHAWNP